MELALAVLIASLLGSLHCAGMCGPLVAFAVGSPETRSWGSRFRLHAAYHGGRLVTYTIAGAACGLVGAAVDLGGSRLGLYRAAALLAGGMMVAVGAAAVLRYSGVRVPSVPLPNALRRALVAGQRAAIALRPLPRALTIGLITALLPCGWLYLFAVVAAGTASPWRGAVVMAAFWLGTVPVLVSLGIGVQAIAGPLGRRLPLVTALAIVLLGVSTLVFRMTAPAEAAAPPVLPVATEDAIEQVEALPDTTPPCCRHHQPPPTTD